MRPARLGLAHDVIRGSGLLDLPATSVVEARAATDAEVLAFHTPEYIEVLKEANDGHIPERGMSHGLGYGDNPVFRGVYDWSALGTGASVQAAELVASGRVSVAFNICGGLHHAMPDRAAGFCYINDPVMAINRLLAEGGRVAYVDVDAHHGDGVELAYYTTDRVLTISIHESGRWLFPGTGDVRERGRGAGEGFAVNLPLPPGVGDALYVEAFDSLVPPFIEAFAPDFLVTQLGVDSFAEDPITHLSLTISAFEGLVERFRAMDLPWVALGGGGYDLANVARAWTVAWAVMNGVDAPERVPAEVMASDRGLYFSTDLIRGEVAGTGEALGGPSSRGVMKDVEYLLKHSLPQVAGRRARPLRD